MQLKILLSGSTLHSKIIIFYIDLSLFKYINFLDILGKNNYKTFKFEKSYRRAVSRSAGVEG